MKNINSQVFPGFPGPKYFSRVSRMYEHQDHIQWNGHTFLQGAHQALLFAQAQMPITEDHRRKDFQAFVTSASNPVQCQALGEGFPRPSPYITIKLQGMGDSILFCILFAKFMQNSELRQQLFDTGSRLLAYAEPSEPMDKLQIEEAAGGGEMWALREGTNNVGGMLMALRQHFQGAVLFFGRAVAGAGLGPRQAGAIRSNEGICRELSHVGDFLMIDNFEFSRATHGSIGSAEELGYT